MDTREFWIDNMLRIAEPVLRSLAGGTLRRDMPLKCPPSMTDCAEHTYLEALGRTLMGVAPWLEHTAEDEREERLRAEYAELARAAIANAVDPRSPDRMNFSVGGQPIVDAAFLAEGLLRAPHELWEKLGGTTKAPLIACMKKTRSRKPCYSNWLLFSAIIEAFLCRVGEADWDRMRVDYALRKHMEWYLGDGVYGDGPEFHFDYYNSYVIQPMLVDILDAVGGESGDWAAMREPVRRRATRYASILERLINRDGSYPVMGRSSAYRFGAFQSLAQAALNKELELPPAQVRCALTAVIGKVMSYPDVFDGDGWLNIGVCGEQPSLGEYYISTGSLYLCCAVFLPLGLPRSDEFWSGGDRPWTARRIWDGEDVPQDHSI